MSVEYEYVLETGSDQAVYQIVHHAEKGSWTQGQSAWVSHMMLADACHDALSHQYMGTQAFSDLSGNHVHAAPVMLHRHVLEMLLDRCQWEDTALKLVGLHG